MTVISAATDGVVHRFSGRSAIWTELGDYRANPDDPKRWDEFVNDQLDTINFLFGHDDSEVGVATRSQDGIAAPKGWLLRFSDHNRVHVSESSKRSILS